MQTLLEVIGFGLFLAMLLYVIPMAILAVWDWYDDYRWVKRTAKRRQNQIRKRYHDRES